MLNAKDQVERIVEVRLDYRGLPPNLAITSGQLNRISLRIRGPIELLRIGLREIPYYIVDLSNVTPGDNIIPFAWGNMPSRAFEVLETIPSRMILHVEQIKEITVPVSVHLRHAPVTPSLRITDLSIDPPTVKVRGPASAIESIKDIQAEIPADLLGENKEITEEIPLAAHSGVEIIPQVVKIQRTLDVRRRTVTLQRDIVTEDEAISVQPGNCALTVSIPHSLARDSSYLAQFQVTLPSDVSVPQNGSPINITLQVSTPQGGRLIRIVPDTVTLSRHSRKETHED